MEIRGIGEFTKDIELDWYYSEAIAVKVLGGEMCRIVLAGYDEDENKEEFYNAIRNFLTIDQSVLREAEGHVFQYYRACIEYWDSENRQSLTIENPQDVWKHVQFGREAMVDRRHRGEKGIYISLECECDWEMEHGLQIVFKNGLRVNKVGPYDGHLTTSDAFNDMSLEDVIYR
jgi:hypothetical protein